jgi:phytoene desaturase
VDPRGIAFVLAYPELVNDRRTTPRSLTQFFDQIRDIPDLAARLKHKSFITPEYFEETLGSYLGNGFGVEPVLTQTAFFRPHNKSEDVRNLYLVGQGTQPGGGTPSVMMSAKMTAREIARDLGVDAAVVNGVPREAETMA